MTNQDVLAPDDCTHDLGTCWILVRDGSVARCVTSTAGDDWELRMIVNGDPLFWKRCRRAADVADIAGDWKARMIDHGWAIATPAGQPVPVSRSGAVTCSTVAG